LIYVKNNICEISYILKDKSSKEMCNFHQRDMACYKTRSLVVLRKLD